MKFRIHGCIRETGADIELIIEAANKDEAEKIVFLKGFLIQSIEPYIFESKQNSVGDTEKQSSLIQEKTHHGFRRKSDGEVNFVSFLILLCLILLIRGCIVVNHPILSESDKMTMENWEKDWWTTVQARDAAKEIYQDTGDPRWRHAAKNFDQKQYEQWEREPENLGSPRTGEIFITFGLAIMCIVFIFVILRK